MKRQYFSPQDTLPTPTGWWSAIYYSPLTDGEWEESSMDVLGRSWPEAAMVAESCVEPGQRLASISYMGRYSEWVEMHDDDGNPVPFDDWDLDDEAAVVTKNFE